jgi:DNA polymerase I-like protein with 3'-5' exonuclease and polymerase domains
MAWAHDVKRLFWDIETDGLLDTITKIHCIVMRDLDDETLVSQYLPSDFLTALQILENADEAWGHNAIAFDVPALRKVLGWTGPIKVFDSMLASQLAFPDLIKRDYATHVPSGAMQKSMAGSHSIEAWGIRLGEIKVGADIEDFSVLSPDLLARCIADTSIGVDVVRQCSERLPAMAWNIECALAPYLVQQEANGIAFDVEKAQALTAKLRGKQLALREDLAIWGGSWVAESGKPWIPKRDNVKLGYLKGVPVQKMKTVSFNPNSRPQIVKRLKEVYGWEPEVFTDANNPKLDEAVLLPLGAATLQDGTPRYPIVQQMIEHFEVGKHLGFLSDGKTSWLKLAHTPDITGKDISTGLCVISIHHHVNQLGTAYARASHSHPNLSQVPVLKDKTTGQDLPPTQQVFRELFYVPERISDVAWSFCGVDMSGIELRMLAHFAYPYDGGEYATIVLDGDPHAANAEAWGVSRTIAKTGIYAWLYGAGDKKLGRTLHPYLITERDQMAAGRKGRATIAERFIGLGRLVERVRDKASAQGYLTGLDGRTIPIRADYSALNNVLQTGAAVAAKVWINNVNRSLLEWLGPQGWNGKWAAQLWVHDELQIACGTGIAEYVKDVMIQGIEDAGRMLNLSVPLAGAGRIGRTWADTH